MTTPLSLLQESIKAVPSIRYALGVAGLLSVIAIARSFNLSYQVAVLGTIIMFVLMTTLVVFARLSALAGPDLRLPALVFTWFSLIFTIIIALLLLTCVFFHKPIDLQSLLLPQSPGATNISKTHQDNDVTNVSPASAPAAQGMNGADTNQLESPKLNQNCPEITFFDYSQYPPESHKEHRCTPN